MRSAPSLKVTTFWPAVHAEAAAKSIAEDVIPALKVKGKVIVPSASATVATAGNAVHEIREYGSKFSPGVNVHVAKLVDPAFNRIVDVVEVNLNTLGSVKANVSPGETLDESIFHATVACHEGISGCLLSGGEMLLIALNTPVTCAERTVLASHKSDKIRKINMNCNRKFGKDLADCGTTLVLVLVREAYQNTGPLFLLCIRPNLKLRYTCSCIDCAS